jgi:PAS domain S-box-containing protein
VTVNAAEGLLLVSIGACTYLAMLQLWRGFRDEGPSRWAGAWSIFAVAFAAARLVQLTTDATATAISAARFELAVTPLLLWSLCRLVGSVCGHRPRRGELGAALVISVATTAAILLTDWFVLDAPRPARDLFGEPFVAARFGPGLWLSAAQTGVAIFWCFWTLVRSRELSARERWGFGASLAIYAGMGVSSLLSAFGAVPTEGLLEYGPLVVSVGASRMLAVRQRRQERALEQLIAERVSALRESEARYREVIENAPIGFLAVDAGGQLVHANAALLAMLGSTRAQFEEGFDVANDASARRSGFSEMLERALATGEVLTGDFEFDTWWGRHLSTRASVAPWRDASGTIAGALAIIEDNTQRRAFERQLQRAQRLEAVGQLAAGIAHEINNPMAYVRSNLSVLGEELSALEKSQDERGAAAPAEMRASLRDLEARRAEALASVQRTVSIVRDLRDFSRASAGEREVVDVNAQLEQAARLASTRGEGAREVALALGDVPRVAIDASQLRLVLLNLLSHAQQAAGASGRVRAATAAAEGWVLISVHDDGPPIRPEERSQLFEPFAASRGPQGPSLGLYVSQQIVREHDGRLEVLSSDGHGTTFVVRLPVANEEGGGEPGAEVGG